MMGCGMSTVKYLLFIFNLIFVVSKAQLKVYIDIAVCTKDIFDYLDLRVQILSVKVSLVQITYRVLKTSPATY